MTKTQLNVLVPEELKLTMRLIALVRNKSLSEVVRGVLEDYVSSSDGEIKELVQQLRYGNKIVQ